MTLEQFNKQLVGGLRIKVGSQHWLLVGKDIWALVDPENHFRTKFESAPMSKTELLTWLGNEKAEIWNGEEFEALEATVTYRIKFGNKEIAKFTASADKDPAIAAYGFLMKASTVEVVK